MVGDNPFPGLRPFEADESHLFFGRETATDDLLRKLRNNRFIAVVGTSGSGKSSLVRAGMLPDLYGGFMAEAGSRWRVAILRPGDTPLRALAESLSTPGVLGREGQAPEMQRAITETVLRRGVFGLVDATRQARLAEGDNLLVLVDQFEELFRIQPSLKDRDAKDESAAFVKLLLEAAKQTELSIYVMLTMRSEYLGDCTRFRDLPEAINAGQYLIPRMTRDEARKAITGPIAVAGARIASPLVQRLLNDVGDNPDQLPIMQHAMMRTWNFWEADHQQGEEIGLAHYQATGGMEEALSRHADEAYEELPDAATRGAAARIFKRLTGRGAGDREMRYPATVAELCAVTGGSRDKVLAALDAFRRDDRSLLMPSGGNPLNDETMIDISHESLIRIWKRLRQWVEEESQSARMYTRLAETSDLFRRKEAGLWRNPDLQLALNWRQRNRPNEVWSLRYHAEFAEAMRFLDASKSAAFRRKLMTIVPAVLIPLAGAAYMVNKAFTQTRVVEQRLADVKEEKAEYQTALEQAQETSESEQQIVEQVVAQVDKLQKLEKTTQVFASREAELNSQIDRLADEYREVVSREAPEAEQQKIRDHLMERSRELEEIQKQAQQDKAKIETEIVASAEQLTAELTVAGQLIVEPETPIEVQPPGVDKTNMAALEMSSADQTVAVNVEAPGAAPEKTDGVTEMKERASEPEVRVEQPALAPVMVANVGNDAGLVQGQTGDYASILVPENFLTCTNVKSLVCVNATDDFSPGKIYVFARVHAPESATLNLKWLREDGSEFRAVKLKVKQNTGRGFRTYVWRTVTEPGAYVVQLYNEKDMIIGERPFTVR